MQRRMVLWALGVWLISAIPTSAENWPRFRGPSGQGHAASTNLPIEWSTDQGIAWKTPISGEGWSSPIVWNNQVFVTSAQDEGRECHVLALDLATGNVLWDRLVFAQSLKRKEQKNSFATPTPCTDGERIYACFADGSMAAVSLIGELLWTNRDFPFFSKHGLGASPIVYDGLVIMPYDGSSDGAELEVGWKKPWDKAQIVAFEAATGKVVWKSGRGLSRISHMTPLIVSVNDSNQLISPAGDRVQGFDPISGKLIWSVYSQGEGVTPSPVTDGNLLFTSSGFEALTLRTIKLTGARGDVTQTHIAWEQKKGAPTLSSLIYVSPYLYAVTDNGVITAYEGSTGELVWQDRLGGTFSASPISAEGRLYILSEQGDTTVLAPGDKFHVLAKNSLGERCQASFAVAEGRLIIRSDKHVYCVQR
jgi:outer membrane protein assembly factor BamB